MKLGGNVVVVVADAGAAGDGVGVGGVGTMLFLLYTPGTHVLEPTTVSTLLDQTHQCASSLTRPRGETGEQGRERCERVLSPMCY